MRCVYYSVEGGIGAVWIRREPPPLGGPWVDPDVVSHVRHGEAPKVWATKLAAMWLPGEKVKTAKLPVAYVFAAQYPHKREPFGVVDPARRAREKAARGAAEAERAWRERWGRDFRERWEQVLREHGFSVDLGEHLRTLGLEKGASPDAVKAAWKRAAFEFHPDRGGDVAAFVRAKRAYEALQRHGGVV